jgi:hypothetical protein
MIAVVFQSFRLKIHRDGRGGDSARAVEDSARAVEDSARAVEDSARAVEDEAQAPARCGLPRRFSRIRIDTCTGLPVNPNSSRSRRSMNLR